MHRGRQPRVDLHCCPTMRCQRRRRAEWNGMHYQPCQRGSSLGGRSGAPQHLHWVMSFSSFEPPPVKMLRGAGSTAKTATALAWLVVHSVPLSTPSPLTSHGRATVQVDPRLPPPVHV